MAQSFDQSRPPRAKYTPAERRLVAEWAAREYPDELKLFQFRIGAGPRSMAETGLTEEEWRSSYGMLRRYADVLVVTDDRWILVEGKIVSAPVAVGELELYARLLPSTPELADLPRAPIELVLLYAVEDAAVSAMARDKGMRTVLFRPPWVDEYLRTKRERGAAGKARDRALDSSPTGRSP